MLVRRLVINNIINPFSAPATFQSQQESALTLRFLRRPGGAITLRLGEGALVQSFAMTERILENLFTEYYDCTGYADSRFIVSGSQQTNTIGITHRHDRWLVP